MPLRKIKRRIKFFDLRTHHLMYLAIAIFCILAGYIIAIIGDSSQEGSKDLNKIQKILSDSKDLDTLKEKVNSNPELLKNIDIEKLKKSQAYRDLQKQ